MTSGVGEPKADANAISGGKYQQGVILRFQENRVIEQNTFEKSSYIFRYLPFHEVPNEKNMRLSL